MFDRILVPVDLSELNQTVLDHAAGLAAAHGSSLVLLHVIETLAGDAGEGLEDFYAGLRERAEQKLSAWSEELSSRGAACETWIREGRRAPTIVGYAEESRCDLILLRSHRLDLQHPARQLGSISHQVALAAGCSVLVLR